MKTVLVTGGTVRIGKAIADRLRDAGWKVLVSSHRAEAGADVVADLSDPMGAARLYSAALALLGGNPPDALVNNAALFVGDPAVVRAVDFDAPKKLVTLMAGREGGVGSVVNVLDCTVLAEDDAEVEDWRRDYLKAKRDLLDHTRHAAVAFAATLRVNGVAPGPVLAPTQIHEPAGELLLEHRPTVRDVADAVAYLLDARATTGCVIPVDGGKGLL